MSASRKTIFLVDDNETNLIMGKSALSDLYSVFTLSSGERLFKILEKLTPDLILLDVEMPGMGGYQVLEQLKKNSKTADLPVIFLTALSSEETELHGLTLGAVDYITKPFSPPLLRKRIELHLLVESQKHKLIDYNSNLERMVAEKIQESISLKNAVLKTMAELVEHRDIQTGHHVERTQQFIKVLIDAMKQHDVYTAEISQMDQDLVVQSSQLHDVGKISIKDSILLKPGLLTTSEFEEMKAHTTTGERILARMQKNTPDSDFLEYARIFSASHHEKWDGTGYPNGLKGEEIPLLGRIMAIADVYDALVTNRPYKKAFPHSQAVTIIRSNRGVHFDPNLTDLFLKVHSEFEQISTQTEYSEATGITIS
ncbi:MAG: response regulator [Oscillospiraceae bacterium]|nr:response regulator [Oscillospiraceae bacterium]